MTNNQSTIRLACYNGRQGHQTFKTPDSIAEMLEHCSKQSHIWFRSIQGDARQAKVNGRVRTWKRNPNRIEVPIKYGFYEYGTFFASDIDRILIPVSEITTNTKGEN